MPEYVIKRDESKVTFDADKIKKAIWHAVESVGGTDKDKSNALSKTVICFSMPVKKS